MKKLVIAFLFFTGSTLYAQSPVSTRLANGVDVGAAFKDRYTHPSIAYYQLLNLDSKKIVSVGYTIRLAAFYGNNLMYTTSPARLTRGETGFRALSASLVPSQIDTMYFDRVTVTSVNFGLRAQVRLGPVELGASADMVGLGFGKRRTGHYYSSNGTFALQNKAGEDSLVTFTGQNALQKARPYLANVRLLGDNDFGTLVTEVYGRVRLGQKLGIKIGYHWITTEMWADRKNTIDKNDRFRNRASMIYVGLTFPIF